MFWNDPILYGATLPYRDIQPFAGVQNFPKFVPPYYGFQPFIPQMNLPYVPQQQFPFMQQQFPFMQQQFPFVPQNFLPYQQMGMNPYLPYFKPFTY